MFGRKKKKALEKPTNPPVVLHEGNPDCNHDRILYDHNIYGEIWKCDAADCGRHERASYAENQVLNTPAGALTRVPYAESGDGRFYSFRTDFKGFLQPLFKSQWVRKTG